MGSDDGAKGNGKQIISQLLTDWSLLKVIGLALALAVLLFLSSTSPELVYTTTFSSSDEVEFANSKFGGSNLDFFSDKCHTHAERLKHCQQQQEQPTWVLACHRRWCNSFGHCEACAGIGDRTRFLLGQVTYALNQEHCFSIRIDAPQPSMKLLDSAVYQDGWGWIAELFRFRSYNVNDRVLNLTQVQQISSSSSSSLQSVPANQRTIYSHFFPYEKEGGKTHPHLANYDACYFHLLFQPAAPLQAEIDRHNRAIMGSSTPALRTKKSSSGMQQRQPSIGIHFRTGDSTAFGTGNKDARVDPTRLKESLEKMLHCAHRLSTRLYGNDTQLVVPYFLATDNPRVKTLVKDMMAQKPKSTLSTASTQQHPIYTTQITPKSYLSGNEAEHSAWLELYLLAQRDGLVVNVRPPKGEEYQGPAARLSQFSRLAKTIGFIPSNHVQECIL